MQPREFCDCAAQRLAPLERAIVLAHEDAILRRAADKAIERGYVVMTQRRSFWQRLRDAWKAFWFGF